MPYYYISNPRMEPNITAQAEAPSTKKARTLYLDYLVRNNVISWSERGKVRPFLVVDKMEEDEFPTRVQLSWYKQPEDLEPEMDLSIEPHEVPQTPISQFEPEELEPDDSDEEESDDIVNATIKGVFGNSPIMNLSKKSKGF